MVLEKSNRGHTSEQIKTATKMLKSAGFETGLQMMTGLPGDDSEKTLQTANDIIDWGADTTRIYPVLILSGTDLHKLFLRGDYLPQTLELAVKICAILTEKFIRAGVSVLKTGLHPSESYQDPELFIAGPYHPAFGELVKSKIWLSRFENKIGNNRDKIIIISVNHRQLNAAIGHQSVNKITLKKQYSKVVFKVDNSLNDDQFTFGLEKRTWLPNINHT
jgi:histone acetyltransferase (RNA polymerase elongator complex component)